MSETIDEEGKTRGLIAHMTFIGWIIAIVQNNPKNDFASFYIRQMLGLIIMAAGIQILSMMFMFIPVLGLVLYWIFLLASLGVVALWVMSLIGAVNGKKELTPIVGEYFQEWFKAI
jgi:uncharacterized membrane protein